MASETYQETVGNTKNNSDSNSKSLVTAGTYGEVGGLDLYGNRIVSKNEAKNNMIVEYGVVTLKGSNETIELTYSDYTVLMMSIEQGKKGIINFSGGIAIDIVMIGKIETRTRLEKAPIEMKPKNSDKHLKQRVLKGYEADYNDGKGWQPKRISIENGKGIIKKLQANDLEMKKKVRELRPIYEMEYVKETIDGKELLVERKPDHQYRDTPLTRIDEDGNEVVMWYWACVYDDGNTKKGEKKKLGYKRIIELVYNETKGDYEMPKMVDACSIADVEVLDRRGY